MTGVQTCALPIFVGMTTFGASAPYKDLYKHFGMTPENVATAALNKLGKT